MSTGGACMPGGGACVAGRACVAGGDMNGRGHAWQGGSAWQGGMCGRGGMHDRGHVWQILRDTVNERAVRILLECILVVLTVYSVTFSFQKVTFYWSLVRVTLVVAFGFLPQNFGRWCGGDLQIVIFLENVYSMSGVDNQRWWGHSNLTSW